MPSTFFRLELSSLRDSDSVSTSSWYWTGTQTDNTSEHGIFFPHTVSLTYPVYWSCCSLHVYGNVLRDISASKPNRRYPFHSGNKDGSLNIILSWWRYYEASLINVFWVTFTFLKSSMLSRWVSWQMHRLRNFCHSFRKESLWAWNKYKDEAITEKGEISISFRNIVNLVDLHV